MPNEYPQRFLDLLGKVDPTGPVLDVGSGGRKLPGVTSMERIWPEGSDLLGDGMELPFASNRFVLVLSQAVLEHVPEPQQMVDEIYRVLEPGGLVYAEAAFIQPIHQEPHHYFNITPFGMRHLFRNFEILEQGETGTKPATLNWIAEAIGAKLQIEFDYGDYWKASSGVSILGRKP